MFTTFAFGHYKKVRLIPLFKMSLLDCILMNVMRLSIDLSCLTNEHLCNYAEFFLIDES